MTKVDLQVEPGVDGRFVYYPGHLLKGVVELNLDHPKKFRGLYITVFGSAQAQWSQNEKYYTFNRRNGTERVHYKGIHIYINARTYLLGQSGGPTFEVPSGVHRYEFACQFPPDIPYTVGLKHAQIFYYVEAILDIPWHFDKESKIPLTVIPHVDLNFYQHLRVPHNSEAYRNTCSLFCNSGRIQMSVYVPYTGFAIGQKVPVLINYINQSSTDVQQTKIILRRITQYNAQTPQYKTKIKEEDMFVVSTNGVKANESVSFESIFEIPIVMLCTNYQFCSVVQITYVMKIEAVLGGFNSNLIALFPVVIGTVPLREDQLMQNQFMPPESSSYYCPVPYAQPSAPDFPTSSYPST